MIRFLLILLLAAAEPVGAAEDATGKASLQEGVRMFDEAFRDWDGERFAAAAAIFGEAAGKPDAPQAACYWQGVARFHRMLFLRDHHAGAHKVEAERNAAISSFEAALKTRPDDPESHALLGTLFGMKIGDSMLRALRYGPKVQHHQQEALKHGADNPRVRYLLGTALFHTARNPADHRKGLAELEKAATLFTTEAATPAPPGDPRWGASSCQTFLGLTREALGQHDQAATAFRKALALHPADHVAKAALQRVTRPATPPSP